MVRVKFDICVPYESIMDDSNPQSLLNLTNVPDTLQDIAYNIVQDKLNSSQPNSSDNHTKERTIFVVGSKGVVNDITESRFSIFHTILQCNPVKLLFVACYIFFYSVI